MCDVNQSWCTLSSFDLKQIIDKQKKGDMVVVLPIGSCEQHGPHLPVGTDTLIGFQLARAAAARCNCPILVLPPIWVGYSPHHMQATGTITLREETLRAIVCDILYSLSQHKVKKIVLLNSHGGNISLLNIAMSEIARQFSIIPIVVTYWHLVVNQVAQLRKSPLGGMGHAGELETSLMLYLFPELVKTERAVSALQPGDEYFSPEMFARNTINCYIDYLKLSPSGIIGDPLAGSVQEGERLFSILTAQLSNLLADFSKGNIAVLNTAAKGRENENR